MNIFIQHSTKLGLGSNYRKWCSSNRLFCNLIGTAHMVAVEQIKSVYRLDSRPSPSVRGSGFARLYS